MTYLLDFATQLVLSLAVGFSFGAAFANVLIARMDKKNK